MEILACFLSFCFGAGLTIMGMRQREWKQPALRPQEIPKREQIQWDNFFSYNGTREGQKQLEDE